MTLEKLHSSDEFEELSYDTIELLFRDVFPRLSNLAIFNFAFFSVTGSDDIDEQFRQALKQELFRRGFLEAPESSLSNVIVDKFTSDEIDLVNGRFACDRERPTKEDRYVELLTNRDRWDERNHPKSKPRAAKKSAKYRAKSCPGGHSGLGRR